VKTKELKAALSLIGKVQRDPRIGPDRGDQLRKAKRELEVIMQSGKLEQRRLFRVTETIARILLDVVSEDATRK
jgi:hypothetical protein